MRPAAGQRCLGCLLSQALLALACSVRRVARCRLPSGLVLLTSGVLLAGWPGGWGAVHQRPAQHAAAACRHIY
jgi:hypothetical protein